MSAPITRRALTATAITAAFWAPAARAQSSTGTEKPLFDSPPIAGQAALNASRGAVIADVGAIIGQVFGL